MSHNQLHNGDMPALGPVHLVNEFEVLVSKKVSLCLF